MNAFIFVSAISDGFSLAGSLHSIQMTRIKVFYGKLHKHNNHLPFKWYTIICSTMWSFWMTMRYCVFCKRYQPKKVVAFRSKNMFKTIILVTILRSQTHIVIKTKYTNSWRWSFVKIAIVDIRRKQHRKYKYVIRKN